jgi:sigma-E factor negative regulatory protein RseA
MAERPLNDEPRQRLSVLLDGECGTDAAEALCRAWRDDAGLRQAWHTYNLIGDVLRSEDLAHLAARDEAFLATLRIRLADEPVVLAPAAHTPRPDAAPAERPRRLRWAPITAAAGFAAVAGLVVVGSLSGPGPGADGAGRTLAAAGGVTPVAAPSAPNAQAQDPASVLVTDGKVIRDAHLDRYLAAHKQFGGSAVAVPGMVLRSAATVAPAR